MSDSKKQGYIKVYRKFFASAFWGEKREYSKAEAWLDLLNLGAYMPSSKLVRGKYINVDVGEIIASQRYLAERWDWGRQKVRDFLKILEENHQITQKTTQGENLITLVKYRLYNGSSSEENPQNNPPSNPKATHPQPKIKEGKEIKEINGGSKFEPLDIFNFLNQEFIDSAEFCTLWQQWLSYKKERKLANYVQTGIEQTARMFINLGLEKSKEAISLALANNYNGLVFKQSNNQSIGIKEFKKAYAFSVNYYDYSSPSSYDKTIMDCPSLDIIKEKFKGDYEHILNCLKDKNSKMYKYAFKQ